MKKLFIPFFLIFLAAGLQAKDKQRPRLVSLSPADDSVQVSCSPQFTMTFNEPVDTNSGFINLYQFAGDSLVEQFDVTSDISGSGTTVISFSVSGVLSANTLYYITIEAGTFSDTAGNIFNGLPSKNKWNFTTLDNVPPVAVLFSPPNNGMSVRDTQNLIITFSEPVSTVSGSILLFETQGDTVFEAITLPASGVTGDGTNIITIDPTGTFAPETDYYIIIDSACFVDTAGNRFAGIYDKTVWAFSTRLDTIIPVITALFPADNATGVATNTVLTLTFNEWVMLGQGNFIIKETAGGTDFLAAALPDARVTSDGATVITLNPLRDFAPNTDYYVLVGSTAITDLAGNPFTGINDASAWNFTTGADNVAPVVIGLDPPDNGVDVDVSADLTITFSEPVNVTTDSIFIMRMIDNSVAEAIGLPDGRVTGTGTSRITINPQADLLSETAYYILIGPGCFIDSSGNAFAGLSTNQGWNFSTGIDTSAFGTLSRIEISPDPASLGPGGSQQFTAMGYDSAGHDSDFTLVVEWTCDPVIGTIDLQGLFTAQQTGTGYVAAFSDPVTDTVMVAVHGSATFIEVLPDSFIIPLDSLIQFRAMGHDTDGNTWDVAAQWYASGGSVDASGLFQPAAQGSCTISADYMGLTDTVTGFVDPPGVLLPPAGGIVQLDSRVSVVVPPLTPVARIRLKLIRSAFPDTAGLVPLDSFYLSFQLSDTSYVFGDSLEFRVLLTPGDSNAQFYEWHADSGAWFRLPGSFWVAPDTLCIRTLTPGNYLIAIDNLAPTIISADFDTGFYAVAESCTVIIHVTDNVLNSRASLFYRQGGARTSQEISTLLPSRDATVSLVIPGGDVNTKGMSFYASANDGANTVSLSPNDLKIIVNRSSGGDTLQYDRWQLISFPVLPLSATLSALLYDDMGAYDIKKWRMFDWDGRQREYRELQVNTAFRHAHAYWIRTRYRDKTFDADSAVTTPVSAPFARALPPGWSAVSVPFAFAVDWQDVLGASAPDTAAMLGPYYWNGGSWENPIDHPTLLPWAGYYVKNVSADSVTLSLPPLESQTVFTPPKALLAENGWLCRIAVTHDGAVEANDYFGVFPAWGARQYPEPPLPKGMACPTAFFERAGDRDRYMSDIRKTWQAGQRWTYRISRVTPGRAVTLDFSTAAGALPPGYSLCVYDPARKHVFDVKDNARYCFHVLENETARTLKVLAGDSGYIARMTAGFEDLPAVLALHRPHPNPFNPVTTFRYDVPAGNGRAQGTMDVSVTLYDFRGRKVAVLVRGRHDPGYYSAVWNGKDEKGRAVSSGTYFCRMTAGKNTRVTVKAVLLK